MELKDAFLALFGVVTSIIGWIVRQLHADHKDLEHKYTELALKVTEKFVSKDDFKSFTDAVFKKLDRIEEKLDNKADK